jgi:hypothetical protein
MSQRVKDIHRDLIITDQWTEPHSPCKNPAVLNGVEYLNSHAQVLLDRTGAPDNLWFPAQDYLAHVHNLSAKRQINWKIPEQVSRRVGHQIYPISWCFIGLNLYCTWIQSQNISINKPQKRLDTL